MAGAMPRSFTALMCKAAPQIPRSMLSLQEFRGLAMKTSIYRGLLTACAMFYVSACDNASSDVTGSNPVISGDANGFRISGHLYTTGSQVSGSTRVCVEGVCVLPGADGAFTVTGTAKAAAGRVVSSDTLTHAYIVIGNDTLREIPVVSWSEILPANYVVQRNVSVIPDAAYRGNTLQAVYFSNDSIANVVTLAATNSGKTFTGYIYSVYDSSAYANNATVYSWFARVKHSDTTLAYTAIMPVTGLNGDVSVDSLTAEGKRSFRLYSTYVHLGYSLVPNDSLVSSYSEFTRNDTLVEIPASYFANDMWRVVALKTIVCDTASNNNDTLAAIPDTIRAYNTSWLPAGFMVMLQTVTNVTHVLPIGVNKIYVQYTTESGATKIQVVNLDAQGTIWFNTGVAGANSYITNVKFFFHSKPMQ